MFWSECHTASIILSCLFGSLYKWHSKPKLWHYEANNKVKSLAVVICCLIAIIFWNQFQTIYIIQTNHNLLWTMVQTVITHTIHALHKKNSSHKICKYHQAPTYLMPNTQPMVNSEQNQLSTDHSYLFNFLNNCGNSRKWTKYLTMQAMKKQIHHNRNTVILSNNLTNTVNKYITPVL